MPFARLVTALLFLQAAQFSYSDTEPDTLARLKFLTDETQQKKTLCQITAVNGQTFSSYYNYYRTDGVFPKSDIEELVSLHDTAKDSLRYALFSMGINQAYAGIPGNTVEANMFQSCMNHSLDEVANMDESASERADMARHQAAWEDANCDAKMAQLYEAERLVSEGKPLNENFLTVIEDTAMRAAMRKAAAQSESLFSAYVEQFNQECGRTATEIARLRQSEPDAQCLHSVNQLEAMYDRFLASGDQRFAEEQLAQWIPEQTVKNQLAAALHSEDAFWDKVSNYLDNRCQAL